MRLRERIPTNDAPKIEALFTSARGSDEEDSFALGEGNQNSEKVDEAHETQSAE